MSFPPDTVSRDLALIARIRDGDEHALNTLMRLYAEPLYRFAYVRTRNAQLAEDAAQDVFIHIWERRMTLTIQGNVKSYLFQSVRNRAIDMVRSDQAYRRLEQTLETFFQDVVSTNTGEDDLEVDEATRVIQNVLESLPPRTKEIFTLHRSEGMSYPDIARTLGIGIPTIHNQMSRATKAILQAIQEWRSGT